MKASRVADPRLVFNLAGTMRHLGITLLLSLVTALSCALAAAPARATQVRLQLNWAPGADHAPLYYALEQGWFAARGVELRVTPGGGSAFTLDAVAAAEHDMGIADLFTVMRGWSRDKSVTAVMNLFVNAPHTFYWLKDSGIRGIADFPGRRLGALRDDPARRLWRALAGDAGIDADSVMWVDMAHNMKVAALAEGRIDVATNPFFHNHAGYEAAFGERLVTLPWRALGFNPYSNSLIVHPAFLAREGTAVAAVAQTLQRAVAQCLRVPDPCLQALLRANDFLEEGATRRNWRLVETLLRAQHEDAIVGAFDPARLRADQALMTQLFGAGTAFDPVERASNAWLDPALTFGR